MGDGFVAGSADEKKIRFVRIGISVEVALVGGLIIMWLAFVGGAQARLIGEEKKVLPGGSEKGSGHSGLRVGEHLINRTGLHYPPSFKYDDTVGDESGEAEIVGDQQNPYRLRGANLGEEHRDAGAHRYIEH